MNIHRQAWKDTAFTVCRCVFETDELDRIGPAIFRRIKQRNAVHYLTH